MWLLVLRIGVFYRRLLSRTLWSLLIDECRLRWPGQLAPARSKGVECSEAYLLNVQYVGKKHQIELNKSETAKTDRC